MRIYRLETKMEVLERDYSKLDRTRFVRNNRAGIFRLGIKEIEWDGYCLGAFALKEHMDLQHRHPLPANDKKINREMKSTEFCGFISKEQMYYWFYTERCKEVLGKYAVVAIYEVSENRCTIGHTQVLIKDLCEKDFIREEEF